MGVATSSKGDCGKQHRYDNTGRLEHHKQQHAVEIAHKDHAAVAIHVDGNTRDSALSIQRRAQEHGVNEVERDGS